MSSIISHIYISNILKEKYNLNNEFLYGAMLPDILTLAVNFKTKTITHYLRHGILNGSEGDYPDIEKFINENKSILPKNLILQGYLAHLIEDMIWYSISIPKMAIKKENTTIIYTKDNSIHTEEEFSKDIYSDYPIIDRYLLKNSNININLLKNEFLQISDDEGLKKAIKENFKLFDLRKDKLILISKDIFKYYIDTSLEKVSLVLDKIYR